MKLWGGQHGGNLIDYTVDKSVFHIVCVSAHTSILMHLHISLTWEFWNVFACVRVFLVFILVCERVCTH